VKNVSIILLSIAIVVGVSTAGAAAAAKKVPETVVVGTLAKEFEPVTFNHSEHVSNAGGCSECHHQHRAMDVQGCAECHAFDAAAFRKNAMGGNLKPCNACHPASPRAGSVARTTLKAAYHQACFKCHWGDVGSAGKNLESCTEMCHVPRPKGSPQGKR
jgi:hypothetical protein